MVTTLNAKTVEGSTAQAAYLQRMDRPQTAMKRELTPAQRRAIAFAREQFMRAQKARQEKRAREEQLRRMREDDEREYSQTMNRSAVAQEEEENTGTISFRIVLGEVLRDVRRNDHKTLREVSDKAGVSLGYLSEVERGQKEASSELLGSISAALGLKLSQTLRLVADRIEKMEKANEEVAAA